MLSQRLLSVVLVITLVGKSVGYSQSALGLGPDMQSEEAANLTRPFPSSPLSRPASYSWYGLTTFAQATPLRCLGEDENHTYDVAILGMFSMPVSMKEHSLMELPIRCTL